MADELNMPPATMARSLRTVLTILHRWMDYGCLADALHVAPPTVSEADVFVSWNLKHIVNLGRIRPFAAVNLERRSNTDGTDPKRINAACVNGEWP
jgi:hypothetical protein